MVFKSNKPLIILGIILIVIAVYSIPKLNLFSVYTNNLQFSYSFYAYDATDAKGNEHLGDIDYTCGGETDCPYTTDPVVNFGAGQLFDYSADTTFRYNPSTGSGSIHDLGFDITNKDKSVSGGKTYIPPYLNFYFYSIGKATDTTIYPKLYYSLDSPMSCNSNGCTGQLIYSGRISSPLYKYTMDLSNRINTPNINHIYIASFTKYNSDYSWYILDIATNLIVQSVCTEGEIKQVGNEYYVCKNAALVKAYITDLTPAQQQEIINQINSLNLLMVEKAALIQNLTQNLEGQVILINQLTASTQEKALLIQQLSSNITYQANLISQMQLTSAQQLATIQALNLNIAQQAEMIANLQTNLDNKIFLISQLQVENQNQAALISQMNLSFQNQAYIIQQLSANITSDAQIIQGLHLTITDQAQLINQLTLQRDQLAQLVAALNLSNGDTANLLNSLQITVNDQIAIIAQLNRSLQDEQAIVDDLNRTIAEQNAIIEALKSGNIPSDYDIRVIWDKYKIIIIALGALFLVALLSGGKK